MSANSNDSIHDYGHIFLAHYALSAPVADFAEASLHLRLVRDPTRKYVNYLAGKIMILGGAADQAEQHFNSEIRNKGYKRGSYEYLAIIYDASHREDLLTESVYSSAETFVPDELRSKVYYTNGDLRNFLRHKIASIAAGTNFWGISGSIGILLIWSMFLYRVSRVSQLRISNLAFGLLSGTLLAITSWILYAFFRYTLGFWINGHPVNDIIFCIGGIGFIEELVKLIPFLLILRFTSIARKPVDYIVIASACGLGFSFFENLMYIANYGVDVIHSRALTASVAHMAASAIAAYGFVLWKFRYPQRWWLVPVFFLLAAIAHGFYDFWLLNKSMGSLTIVTLFFYLAEIIVFITFLNNAINHSADNNSAFNFDSRKLSSLLAGALVLLFAFEFLASCAIYGTEYGNREMTTAFLSGGYLIFFLSVRMAQIRFVRNKWNKIDVLSGILPSRMLLQQQENDVEGAEIILRANQDSGSFALQLPLKLTITGNPLIKGSADWYECETTVQLVAGNISSSKVYIKAKDPVPESGYTGVIQVGVYMFIDDDENPSVKKVIHLGWADAVYSEE
jgi:RsiW-degrading membrane proteinase PrsW (M82 family)